MTETETHEEHRARRPAPDGSVHVTSIRGEGSDYTHKFSNEEGAGWSVEQIGLVFHSKYQPAQGSEVRSRTIIPWGAIARYDVTLNSEPHDTLLLKWLQDCDHEWLSHPSIGHFCRWCRLDMDDMGKLYDGTMKEPPALVVQSDALDREAEKFDGGHDVVPPQATADGPVEAMETDLTTGVTEIISMADMCDCKEGRGVVPHDGPCQFRPETWPVPGIDDSSGF